METDNAPFGTFFALPEALADALNHSADAGRMVFSFFKLEAFPSGLVIEQVIGAQESLAASLGNAAPGSAAADHAETALRSREVFCVVTVPAPALPPPGGGAIVNPFASPAA